MVDLPPRDGPDSSDPRRGGARMRLFGIVLAVVVLVGAWYLYAIETGPVTTTETVVGAGAGTISAGTITR